MMFMSAKKPTSQAIGAGKGALSNPGFATPFPVRAASLGRFAQPRFLS
jgi:hypothetical protein